jgi:hypothetical protein
LSRTTVVLAEIAAHDPGGNWANRPSNSLTDIFLPWKPHTLASVEKRQAALKIICRAAYDLAQIDLNNDQIEVYLSML